MKCNWIQFLLLLFCVALSGCRTFESKPLVPIDVLKEVEANRSRFTLLDDKDMNESGKVGLPEIAKWLGENSPALIRIKAEFEKAQAVSQIETPFPNPEITFGPQLGTHLGSENASHRFAPLIEFGFTIPLSRRLSYEDDFHLAIAEEKRVMAVSIHRKTYLELRRLFTKRVLEEAHHNLVEKIRSSSMRSLDLTRRLVDAGAASALDVGLMELEAYSKDVELIEAKARMRDLERDLAQLTGIKGEVFDSLCMDLPPLTVEPPPIEEAKEMMVANHPDLASMRAIYEKSQMALRLEIEKQYPDIGFGSSFVGEPGGTKKIWGLSIGIAIPIFDRNQINIKEAEMEREKVRVDYEATLNESLAILEGLYETYNLVKEKEKLLREKVLPRAQANLDAALKSLKAASIDSLKYLEVERGLQNLMIGALKAEEEIRETFSLIEQAIGVPLAFFPNEKNNDYPLSIERLEEPNDK